MDIFKGDKRFQEKKPFYSNALFWFAILIILAIGIGFIPSSSDNLITARAVDEEESVVEPEIVQVEYGGKVVVDDISYKILKIDREQVLPWTIRGSTNLLQADGIYYLIRLEVTNEAEDPVALSLPENWVTSSEGDQFAVTDEAELRIKSALREGEVLAPGIPYERVRIFDVSPIFDKRSSQVHLDLMFDQGNTQYYLPISK